MGELAYMKVGSIKGPAPFAASDSGKRMGLIAVRAAIHHVASDIDTKTGRPTKDRTHQGFSVRKKIDFSSPHLHEAHKKGEENTVEIFFFHMPRSGAEANYFIVTMTKARIVKYTLTMPHMTLPDPRRPGIQSSHEYEDIEFMYESIDWAVKKNEGDPTISIADKNSSDVLAAFGPDWIEEEAKAKTLNVAGRLQDELAEQMLNKYKSEHPGEFPQ